MLCVSVIRKYQTQMQRYAFFVNKVCCVCFFLFSDAEAGEDGAEDFVGGDLAGDGAEVVEGIAEVNDYEVGRKIVGESLGHLQQGLVDMSKGIVVPHVGEHHVWSLCEVGLDYFGQCCCEGAETVALFGGDVECVNVRMC